MSIYKQKKNNIIDHVFCKNVYLKTSKYTHLDVVFQDLRLNDRVSIHTRYEITFGGLGGSVSTDVKYEDWSERQGLMEMSEIIP